MAIETLGAVLREINRLFAGGTIGGCTDGELLERFVSARDAEAFEALVARHGPMVLSVCRGILNDPNDAEDAFQATFLILVKKAGTFRGHVALGGWLYVVAHRAALQANAAAARRRSHERQAGQMAAANSTCNPAERDEPLRALHEAIARLPDRLREVVVLCDLEGVSQERAAAQLQLSKRTLRRRLEQGRRRLKVRLEGRALPFEGGMLAPLLLRESRTLLPPGWSEATARAALSSITSAATAGSVSSAAITLSREVLKTMLIEKWKLVSAAVLGVGLLACGTLTVLSAGEDKPPAPALAAAPAPAAAPEAERDPLDPLGTFPIRGRVLDPDGKPVAGAEIRVQPYRFDAKAGATSNTIPAVQAGRVAATGPDGRFSFGLDKSASDFPYRDFPAWHGASIAAVAPGYGPSWLSVGSLLKGEEAVLRLVRDDVPIRGRILDLEGHPAAGVTVYARELRKANSGVDPDALLAGGSIDYGRISWSFGGTSGLGRDGSWTTDADGRFEIRGVGRDQVVGLEVRSPTLEKVYLYAMARPAKAPARPRPRPRPAGEEGAPRTGQPPAPPLYGSTFEQLAAPTKPITGVVRLATTGAPLAGVHVLGVEPTSWTEVSAVTDAEGRFRLLGLPKAAAYEVRAAPRSGIDPFLGAETRVSDTAGLEPIATRLDLPRGVILSGRLVDASTGKAVRAKHVSHHKLPRNQNPGDAGLSHSGLVDPTFRITVPPGEGMLFANVRGEASRYTRARLRPEDKGKGIGGTEDREARMIPLGAYHAYRIIDVPSHADTLSVDLELTPGHVREGKVVDADGRPVLGVRCAGLLAQFGQVQGLADDTFRVLGLELGHPRLVVFAHKDRRLVGSLVLGDGDLNVEAPLVVRLDRGGSVKGRLVDEDGQPMAATALSISTLDLEGHELSMSSSDRLWPESERFTTDAAGRFRVDGLKPGVKSRIYVEKQARPNHQFDTGDVLGDLVVQQAGEVRDVGDVTVKERPNP